MRCTLGRTCWRAGRRGVRAARAAVGRVDQVEQVRVLGLVQLQGAGEPFEDAVGRALRVPALQAGVVVHADPGQQRDLLAAQPGDAPVTAVRGQAGLLRGDPGPAGGQELADLVPVVHDLEVTFLAGGEGGPVSTWNGRLSLPGAGPGFMDTSGGDQPGAPGAGREGRESFDACNPDVRSR